MKKIKIVKEFSIQHVTDVFTTTYAIGEYMLDEYAAGIVIREGYGVELENTEPRQKNSDTGSNRTKSDGKPVDSSEKSPTIIPGFDK